MSEPTPQSRPVARYVVAPRDGFFWLIRLSDSGDQPVSPYVNLDAALDCAAHLNSHVQWEGG